MTENWSFQGLLENPWNGGVAKIGGMKGFPNWENPSYDGVGVLTGELLPRVFHCDRSWRSTSPFAMRVGYHSPHQDNDLDLMSHSDYLAPQHIAGFIYNIRSEFQVSIS
jgi:hypothetical protein